MMSNYYLTKLMLDGSLIFHSFTSLSSCFLCQKYDSWRLMMILSWIIGVCVLFSTFRWDLWLNRIDYLIFIFILHEKDPVIFEDAFFVTCSHKELHQQGKTWFLELLNIYLLTDHSLSTKKDYSSSHMTFMKTMVVMMMLTMCLR